MGLKEPLSCLSKYLCSIVKGKSESSQVYCALSKLIQKIIDYRRNKLTTNEN